MISVVKALMSAMDTKVALHIANPFLMAAVIVSFCMPSACLLHLDSSKHTHFV